MGACHSNSNKKITPKQDSHLKSGKAIQKHNIHHVSEDTNSFIIDEHIAGQWANMIKRSPEHKYSTNPKIFSKRPLRPAGELIVIYKDGLPPIKYNFN